MSDRVAMFALEILAERGLSVPEDISIVGFDDIMLAATVSPPLTTVVQPIAEIGRRAVKTILEHDGGVHRESLPLELLVRKSTASPGA